MTEVGGQKNRLDLFEQIVFIVPFNVFIMLHNTVIKKIQISGI